MPQIEHRSTKVRDLIEAFQTGAILVPEFQRSYVWKGAKWAKLIDSLYRKYPVGSLLVWDAEDSLVRPRTTSLPNQRTTWLIDGQQRLTTLSKISASEEGIDILFSPESGAFRQTNAALQRDGRWFRVAEIWDDEEYRRLRAKFSPSDADFLEKKCDAVREILNYEIPVVKMINHSFDEAVDAFQRINTLGVKLKAEDIESARVASKHTGFIRDEVLPFLKELRNKGYSRISVIHLFRVCSSVAKNDGRSRISLHEISEREMKKAWKETKKGVERTLDILRQELGISDMTVLWSASILVPPFLMCATQSPRMLNAREIVAWIALAAIHHRYSGSAGTMLDHDVRACRKPDPIQALLKNLKDQRGVLEASERDFKGTILDRSSLLAAYIVSRFMGARDLFSGEFIATGKRVDRHHIIPRGCFPKCDRAKADVIANMAWISSSSNRSIGDDLGYFREVQPEVLESQGIEECFRDLEVEDAEEMWRARRKLFAAKFNEFIREYLPTRRLGRL